MLLFHGCILGPFRSLLIAYSFVKKPDAAKLIEGKIKALRERYPHLPESQMP